MENLATQNPNEDIKKLGALIKDIQFAMLTSQDADGRLHSRPMATQQVSFDGDLWFFTALNSHKLEEVRADSQVNVAYSEPKDQRYVSVSGRAQIVTDKEKAKQLWTPALKAWFPNGLEDPQLALIKVSVESAQFWDSPSSKIVQLVGFAKAMLTGEGYKPSASENQRVNLSH